MVDHGASPTLQSRSLPALTSPMPISVPYGTQATPTGTRDEKQQRASPTRVRRWNQRSKSKAVNRSSPAIAAGAHADGDKPWTDYRSEAVLHRELLSRAQHRKGRETWLRSPDSYGVDGAVRAPWGDAHRPRSRDPLANGDFARVATASSEAPLTEISSRPSSIAQQELQVNGLSDAWNGSSFAEDDPEADEGTAPLRPSWSRGAPAGTVLAPISPHRRDSGSGKTLEPPADLQKISMNSPQMRAATPGKVDAYVIGFMEGSRNAASLMDEQARLAQEREALAWAAGRHGQQWEISAFDRDLTRRGVNTDARALTPHSYRRDVSLKLGAELSRFSASPVEMAAIRGGVVLSPTAGESPLMSGGEAYGSGGMSGVARERAEKRRRARMQKQQRRLQRELDEQNHAACKIQARVRGRSSKRRVAELRHDRERRIQQENMAACGIQRRVRGRQSRRQYGQMRERNNTAASSIQARQRGRMARRKLTEERCTHNRAASSIQARHRGRMTRRQLGEEKHAAQMIQATFRGKQTRDELAQEALAAKQTRAEQELAATKIQARIRGKSARIQVQAISAERELERAKIELQLGATKIQSSFRGRKGRQKAQEELAAKRRLAELELRAVRMFQGSALHVTFGAWVEYRAKILRLRQSSLKKLARSGLVYCFETWADTVAEVVNARQEAVLGCIQNLVDRAVSFDPQEALALKLKASRVPNEDMLDIVEMSRKLAQRSVGTLFSRAVAEPSTKALLDKSVRSSTGGACAELPAKMRLLPWEEMERIKKKQNGLWGKITGACVEVPSPLPGVHIRLHCLARAVSESAIVVAVEVLESVNIYPASSDERGALRCTLRREHADGTAVAGTRVYRATSSASDSISIDVTEEQWQADARNDPLAAPFASVLQVGKPGCPPLLPWAAGTEEIVDHKSTPSTTGDRTSDSKNGETLARRSLSLLGKPPQRRERMLSSTGQLISPGRMLSSIEELDDEDDDLDADGMTDSHRKHKWRAYCPISKADRTFGGVGTSVLPALFLVDNVLSERVGGTIETAAGRKLGSFRLGMKDLRKKALECQTSGNGSAPGTHYSTACWVTIKAPPPSLHLRLMHQSKDPMADPISGGALTLTIEVTGAFALPSDGRDMSDPYCEIR